MDLKERSIRECDAIIKRIGDREARQSRQVHTLKISSSNLLPRTFYFEDHFVVEGNLK